MECSASLRDNDSGVLDRAVYDEKTAAQWEEAEQTEDSKRYLDASLEIVSPP